MLYAFDTNVGSKSEDRCRTNHVLPTDGDKPTSWCQLRKHSKLFGRPGNAILFIVSIDDR